MLEDGEVGPVGGSRSIKVCPRHRRHQRDLEQAVAEGRFRQDLYYRLSVLVIRLPPLRERRADIPLLDRRFFETAARAPEDRVVGRCSRGADALRLARERA